MPELTAATSLAEIVRDVPGSERALESFGLDYCCGGARTLADACRDRDLAPAAVLQRLQQVDPQPQPD